MKKNLILTLLALVAAAASLHAQTKHYELKIGDFSEFTVAHNINVVYRYSTDSVGLAVYDCSPRVAPAIKFTNNKGKIKIEVESDEPLDNLLPTVHIYSSSLQKVSNHGDSTVVLVETKPGDKMNLKTVGNGVIQALDVYSTKLSAAAEAGSGHIFIRGKAQEAKLSVAGAGVIEAASLKADKVQAWMFGVGSIDCTVEAQLSIYGAGTGTVYYSGKPEIKKRNVGVKVVDISEPAE